MEKVNITIVGAGHYGRDLIAPKYKANKQCTLRAVISPHTIEGYLLGSGLEGIEVVRTLKEWYVRYGAPTTRDVFDLCVHHHILPSIVKNLAAIGAKNFIFPKPVALRAYQLAAFLRLKQKHNLKIAIASQWHYSRVTKMCREAFQKIGPGNIKKITLDFSQSYNPAQLENYSPTTALLPHMLQILHSMRISLGDLGEEIVIEEATPSSIGLTLFSKNQSPPTILNSDLRSRKRKRLLSIYTHEQRPPVFRADFLGVFQNGVAMKYPEVKFDGITKEIKEDNLEMMIRKITPLFFPDKGNTEDADILTLEEYVPVARTQILIEKEYRKLVG
jgi:hypothetical protein